MDSRARSADLCCRSAAAGRTRRRCPQARAAATMVPKPLMPHDYTLGREQPRRRCDGGPMVLTKSELITLLQKEVRLLLHLTTKIDARALDYRPNAEAARARSRLLRYLTTSGPGADSVREGAADGGGRDCRGDARAANRRNFEENRRCARRPVRSVRRAARGPVRRRSRAARSCGWTAAASRAALSGELRVRPGRTVPGCSCSSISRPVAARRAEHHEPVARADVPAPT
jgi:hypothetical protein